MGSPEECAAFEGFDHGALERAAFTAVGELAGLRGATNAPFCFPSFHDCVAGCAGNSERIFCAADFAAALLTVLSTMAAASRMMPTVI